MSRCVWIVAFLLSTSAWAGKKGAVAVLDISGTGIAADLLPTLTEVLTVEIDNLGMYKVIGGRDVQAMLGFEKQKDMVGCTDAACLAEIGGALGVDRIVASHIGKVGSTYVVNIKLINIRLADTEARVYETVRGEVDALIETIRKSVRKLLGSDSKAAKALGVAPASKPKPKIAPKPEPEPEPTEKVAAAVPATTPLVEKKVGTGGPGWLPITLWAVGGVTAGLGVVFGITAKGLESEANEISGHDPATDRPIYSEGAQAAAESAETNALLANIFIIGGIAMVGGGFLAWLLGGDDDPATAFVPMVGPGSVGFALSGEF